MPVAAILGAGDLGGAIAQKLAGRGRFREVRLIDARADVAAGKALDIQQCGPLDHADTRLSATADVLAAASASAIIVADPVDHQEWQGEPGLALVRQLVRAGTEAPFVFAGPNQLWLMEAAARELGVAANRLVGTAASALVGVVRALVGVELDGSGTDVQITVAGQPPSVVVAWSSATIAGSLLSDRVAAHRLVAVTQALKALWPPGPHAIAAATAGVVEGLVFGARRLQQAATILEGEFGVRRVGAMLPLRLGHGMVLQRLVPSLSAQERVELVNGLGTKE
jgi:malate/lactate dehydrogenase